MNIPAKLNPLIAVFMGGELKGEKQLDPYFTGIPGHGACAPLELQYHSDWNWTMEALTKIRELIFEQVKATDLPKERIDMLHRWWQRFTITLGTLDRSMAWLDIISFIMWWNKWQGIKDFTYIIPDSPESKFFEAMKEPAYEFIPNNQGDGK